MKYQMNLGRLAAPVRANQDHRSFRIAVLADLSGRANRGQIEPVESRKPWKADVDTLESLIERCEIKLELPIGPDDSVVEVEIGEMDDFHPDELFDKLEFFEELTSLRSRLQNSSTFAAAAQEVSGWASDLGAGKKTTARSGGTSVPRGKLADFAQLLDRPQAERAVASADELIQRIVAPHVVATPDPKQEAMVAAVDDALSAAMRSVLHHPDFQAVESIWRSLDLMTRRIETSTSLEIVLYDITAEELAADLSAHDDLTESGLYQLLVEQPAMDAQQGPLSVLIGNYVFEQTPPHAELLARMAKIAAAAQAPFIAGMSALSLEKNAKDIHPLVEESWAALRQLPESAYLALTSPRFLLRWPYGAKTEPIDPFTFEEFSPQSGLKGMLWGNGAMVAAVLLAETYLQQGMAMKLGTTMTIDDIPVYYYTDKHGDTVALPCTERLITEKTAHQLKSAGFIPVLSIKGQPVVRLGGFESVSGALLAGPWAPADVSSSAAEPAIASSPTPEVEPESVAPAVSEPDDVGADTDEDDAGDSELDALLADLESDADAAESDDDEEDGGMDPELAALLEDL